MLGATRWFIFAAFVVLAAIAMVVFAGGIIKEVSEARQRGEWGKFGAFLLAGLFVVVIVMAAAWWGSGYLDQLTTTRLNNAPDNPQRHWMQNRSSIGVLASPPSHGSWSWQSSFYLSRHCWLLWCSRTASEA